MSDSLDNKNKKEKQKQIEKQHAQKSSILLRRGIKGWNEWRRWRTHVPKEILQTNF